MSTIDNILRVIDEGLGDEIKCRKCGANGAPDKCWNCGRDKRKGEAR